MLACTAAVLAVTGCTPEPPTPPVASGPASADARSSAGASASAPDAPAGKAGPDWPDGPEGPTGKVLSDEELMALMARAIDAARQGAGRVSKTADLRARLRGQPEPADRPAAEPGECGVFQPRSSPAGSADLAMNFAAGVLTLTGAWSRDAVAFVLARSAPRHDVVAADFAYTDEQAGKCATFRRAPAAGAPPSTVRLQTVPGLGERAYVTVSSPPSTPGAPPGASTISLQVLQGTVSIGLRRQAPAPTSEAELQSALEPLAGVAQTLAQTLDQASDAGTAAATPPAEMPAPRQPEAQETPEQLAQLLQGITGPDGGPARVLARRYAATAPATPPEPATPGCLYDDAAYLASLGGAATVVAEIPSATREVNQISLRLISLPPSSSDPPPFDRRAADLGTCSTVLERLPGGGTRTWSSVEHPTVDTSGPTGYAVVYALADGTGVRHVRVGARKGSLCVESETTARSDSTVQQAAHGLAATINKVMARVGS